MELISSFAISYAAGIALDLWSKSKQTFDKEIKKAFSEAMKDWCPNESIREGEKESLKQDFLIISEKPEMFSHENYSCFGEYEKFYIIFRKKLSEYQVAYNYINLIQDEHRYKQELSLLSNVKSTVENTNEKVTEILLHIKGDISKKEVIKSISTKSKKDIRKVLFNNYKEGNEDYYLERNIDLDFCSCLDSGNIWIYGFSGIGKTALINRNLIKNSIEYINCDFSPITISSPSDVLDEIMFSISEKYGIELKSNSQNQIKKACDLLTKIETKEVVIVIDELSIKDSELLKGIIKHLVNLLNHHCNQSNCSILRFVVSTINEPIFDDSFNGKALEYFDFIEISEWKKDMEKLLNVLVTALELNLNDEMQLIILKNSKSSPRLLKSIIRKICSLDIITKENVQEISERKKKEHF